jgi:hypothetical protein
MTNSRISSNIFDKPRNFFDINKPFYIKQKNDIFSSWDTTLCTIEDPYDNDYYNILICNTKKYQNIISKNIDS